MPKSSTLLRPNNPTTPSTILSTPLPLPTLIAFDLDYTLWPFWVDTHVQPPLSPNTGPDFHPKSKSNSRSNKHFRNTSSSSSPAAPESYPGQSVRDGSGEAYAFYEDVPDILCALRERGIKTAAASRTHAPELAREMLGLLSVPVPNLRSEKQEEEEEAEEAKPDIESGVENSVAVKEEEEDHSAESRADSGVGERKRQQAISMFDHLAIYPGNKISHFKEIKKATGVPYEDMLFFDDEARNKNVEKLGVTMCLVRNGVSWGEVERGIREWRNKREGGI